MESIDKADYALLNAVHLEDWQVYLLAAPNMHDIMNTPEHGLDPAALFEHFLRLWRMGLIECSMEDPFRPIAPDPALLHEQFDPMPQDSPPEGRIIIYRLTKSGGLLWEELSAPDWSRLIRQRDHPCSKDNQEWEISGADQALLERTWKLHNAWGDWPHPVEGTVRYEVLQPYRPAYWKTLPIGYAYRFEVQSGWERPPLYHSAVAALLPERNELWEIGIGWRRSFEDVCRQFFE